MEKQNLIYHEYLFYQKKYEKIYGKDSTICIIQVGDFYEIYSLIGDDDYHNKVAEITNLVKTRKNKAKEASINNPYMSGFNIISLDRYMKMLLDANFTVVCIAQITNPPKPKRGVVGIYSSGTYANIDQVQANYIVSLYIINEKQQNASPLKCIGMCAIDCSTGQCGVYETTSSLNDPKIALDEAYRFIINYSPKEILLVGDIGDMDIVNYLELERMKIHKMPIINKTYEKITYQNEFFNKIYKNNSLLSPIENLNMETMPNARLSFITLLDFIHKHNENFIKNISMPDIFLNNKHLILYNDAIQQLNILENHTSNDIPNTKIKCLLDIVNNCVTPMGKRYMKYAITNPLNDIPEINLRYECTDELIKLKLDLDPQLRLISDTQKLSRRITLNTISPNDLTNLMESLNVVNEIYNIIKTTTYNAKCLPSEDIIQTMNDFINEYSKTFNLDEMRKYNSISDIEDTIFNLTLYPEIDKLHDQIKNAGLTMDEIGVALGKYIDELVKEDDNKTKKSTTKIQLKTNKKLGSYLQLTKIKGDILQEKLKDMTELKISESITLDTKKLIYDCVAKGTTKIYFKDENVNSKNTNNVHEKLKNTVRKKFSELLINYNMLYCAMFREISTFISKIDFTNSNSKTASINGYCKPVIIENDKSFVDIKKLRHPIGERVNNNIKYVSHDICLGKEGYNDGMLIFGVNSSGKSSLMKALGVAIIMAQCGLYVSCDSFEYYPYHQLFARITNNDNIYKKLSSFSHEMQELSKAILRNDKYSVVLGDEIVQSTEKLSGVAIVGATLVKLSESKATYIFASHMHELVQLSAVKNLKNLGIYHLSVEYDEKTDALIFSRELREGNGNTFYGLTVGKYIIKNDEFMKLAYEIKNEIMGENNDILPTLQSKYCPDLYLHACQVCGQLNTNKKNCGLLDTHHIKSQKQCKVDAFAVGGLKMNDACNLIVLCKKCHYDVHHDKLLIRGYKDTTQGKVVDFERL
jgi:DNA mismatch repair protein MutS